MKVFLTGATGYVGSVVLRRLLAAGDEVIALARQAPGRQFLEHPRLHWRFADLRETAVVAECAHGADATIHTAAEHAGAMREVDDRASDGMIDGLRGSGKPLISTSATVVYGDTGLIPRIEAGPILSPHPLREWRIANDQRIADAGTLGIRGVVVRPPTIYGTGAGPMAMRIAAAAKAGYAQYIGDGASVWSSVHVLDLADLYVALLRHEAASGIYNAASAETLSRRALAEAIAATLGPAYAARSITLEEGRAIWGFLADLSLINQVISGERARSELQWSPSRPPLMELLRSGRYHQETIWARG
jgi:nucleoside-diphosphate-sugar epimerase